MKRRILSAVIAAMLSVGVFSAPVQEFAGTSSVAQAASAVSAPKASKKAGTYSVSGAFSVKLTSSTSGAKIYYSTGGSYKLYTKALKISKTTTLKCYAEKNGVKSKTVSYTYKLVPKVTFSADAGTYDDAVTVKLSSTASGVKFYYTLDGSKPTTSSKLYTTSGIKISKTATLRVLAYKSGWTKKYFTKKYKINAAASDLSGESILDDYTRKYAYNTLTTVQKKVYAALFEAAKSHGDADVSGIGATEGDVQKAYWAFDYDNPQFFWLGNGYSYSIIGSSVTDIYITYSRTVSESRSIQPKLEAAAKPIIQKALEQDDLFDRVMVIHDAIVDMTDYTASGPVYKSEADGVLVYGKALCEGYSKAFMYLCQSVGIECICVSGSGSGQAHMWNMLRLDGEWYNMDVTWDDPIGGEPVHEYFCIPTSKIKSDHKFDNPFPVPSATADKYSYSKVMGIQEYTTVSAAYKGLVEQAAANYKKGIYITTVYVSDGLMDSLISKVGQQSFFSDLNDAGCYAASWSASYTNKSITITLR